MGDYYSEPGSINRGMTLSSLKNQLYSLNMRMLLAMKNHDEQTQADIQEQIAVLQKEIDQMCLGGRHH